VNFINRILATFVLCALIATTLYLGAVVMQLIPLDARVFGTAWQRLPALQGWQAGVVTAAAALLALAALAAIIIEWRPTPRRKRPFIVSDNEHGSVSVERDSVCKLAEKVISAMDNVKDVKATVALGPQGIHLHCAIVISAAVVLPELGSQLQEEARARIEAQLGIPIAVLSAKLRYVPYRADNRALL